jgi:hypothetical protein
MEIAPLQRGDMQPQFMVPTNFDRPFLRMKRSIAIAGTEALLLLLLPVFGMMTVAAKAYDFVEAHKRICPSNLKWPWSANRFRS